MDLRERFQAAADLFLEAERLSVDQIDDFLDRRCGSDQDLRNQVRQLLAARDKPSVFASAAGMMESMRDRLQDAEPASSANPLSIGGDPGREEAPNEVIGRYRLIEPIGEGGFGRVWLAEQREPVQRRVALKLIKAGMDSREVLARFETERQALAVMDHPNVARVFDAGMTERGRPYFVMEQTPGPSITNFCDEGKLRLRERLALFIPVCEAVHHAHQKGLIHRDLKPSNILVTLIDGRPVPKVIDFGIAKATRSSVEDRTVYTEAGRLMGTPEYMSPEQAGGGIDVDTRSDVYSLGVVLYQLLTGTLPFEGRMLRDAGREGIVRIIRELDPPRPSARAERATKARRHEATEGEDSRSEFPSWLRGSVASWLPRQLRGDLDWVVMKCLEKDRARRYESASELAADLNRYLAGEPVTAAPPSKVYRLSKFVRRNRAVVVGAAAVATALVLGVIGFAWQAHRVGIERDAANAQRNRAVAAEAETQRRADELAKVADFQARMLAQVDPTTAGLKLSEDVRARFESALAKAGIGGDEQAALVEAFVDQWSRVNATDAARELIDRTILQPAIAAIDERFADQPVVAATLRDTLADRYKQLGLYDSALSLEEQALAERRRVLGDAHPDTLTSINNVGAILSAKGKPIEAEVFYREALEKRRRVLGADHPNTLASIHNLSAALNSQGKLSEAEQYLREALDGRQRILGSEHPDTLGSVNSMGSLLTDQGRHADAESYYRDAYEKRRRVLGREHPETLNTLGSLAAVLRLQGRLAEAITTMREVVDHRRRVLGEAHPDTLRSIQGLGSMLGTVGQSGEAEKLMREALADQQRVLGRDHPSTLNALNNLAVFLIDQGKAAEAEPMCRELLERRQRVSGKDHPSTLVATNVLSYLLRRQSKPAEAEPYAREALAISRRVLGTAHPDTFRYTQNLGAVLREQGRVSEAEPLFREVVQAGRPVLGDEHLVLISGTASLGDMLVEQGRFAEAAELLTAGETSARKTFTQASERKLATFLLSLGKARAGLDEFAVAESKLLEAHGILIKSVSAEAAETRACTQALADLYTAWNIVDPSADRAAQSAEWRTAMGTVGPKSSDNN